jgi:SNF2 family DNA or RNA helicase
MECSMNYEFKTKPFSHQLTTFEETWHLPWHAVFWEQGTGKTKLIIDTAAKLYMEDEIDALVILAPEGVHRNWITDEIPIHMPDSVAEQARTFFYQSGRSGTKWHKAECEAVKKHDGLAVLAMTYDAAKTKKRKDWIGGHEFLKNFLTSRRAMLVLDEATRIKSPSAGITKIAVGFGRAKGLAGLAEYRRILTGTPVANGPFDVFSIFKFLSRDFWADRGFSSFHSFKTYFGIFRTMQNREGRQWEQLLDYRNVEELEATIGPHSSRVTKDEVLDLPPKLYQKRYFDLSPEQERAYRDIREEFMLWLESGEMITAPLAITRLLRLHQITSGYIPHDEGEEVHLFSQNPRLKLLEQICEDTTGKAIIWARFRRDIDQICEMLGDSAVRYDGGVSADDRARAISDFQQGGARWFVANPQAAGEGLTLHAATTVIYYNNSFKLTERLQSEDRAHRIGQEHPVTYIDIIAPGTVDEHIVKALREKQEIARVVLGDQIKEWL